MDSADFVERNRSTRSYVSNPEALALHQPISSYIIIPFKKLFPPQFSASAGMVSAVSYSVICPGFDEVTNKLSA